MELAEKKTTRLFLFFPCSDRAPEQPGAKQRLACIGNTRRDARLFLILLRNGSVFVLGGPFFRLSRCGSSKLQVSWKLDYCLCMIRNAGCANYFSMCARVTRVGFSAKDNISKSVV